MLTMADKGGGGFGEMLTMADKGERGGGVPPFLADIICEEPQNICPHPSIKQAVV